MTFGVEFKRKRAVAALAIGVAMVCALLARQVLFNFIVFSLSDSRSPVNAGALQFAASYFPSSARLNARLAEARLSDPERDLDLAARDIERATRLSPFDYRLRVVMAAVKESERDLAGAEVALRDAASLAPSNTDVRWRLANLLLREYKVRDALVEFRAAVLAEQALLPATLDLVWRVTGGDLASLESVAPATPSASLSMAGFLLKQRKTAEAASIFEAIDPEARLAAPASSEFIGSMARAGELALARHLWADTVSGTAGAAEDGDPVIWNGGFESDPIPGFAQFDWTLRDSAYASTGIDPASAHQGSRSLRIDFRGRETTRLDGEIAQALVLRGGVRYRLECYVRTQNFVSTDGPRLTLRSDRDPAWMPASPPIPAGTADWRKIELEFVAPLKSDPPAPADGSASLTKAAGQAKDLASAAGRSVNLQTSRDTVAVTLSVIRVPRYSYDDPMRGTIWLDDFSIVEIN